MVPTPSPLPGLSRLRELGDELLGELSSVVPNLTERTKGHVSLVDAIVKKVDCGGTFGSILAMLGLGGPSDADAVEPPERSGTEGNATVIPIEVKPEPATGTPVESPPARDATRKAATRKAPAKKAAARKPPAKKAPAAKAAATTPVVPGELAIPGYDSLAASQVIPRLDSLSPADLEALRLHELGGRGRRTILTRIAQIQGR